jgi:hypothetical protein
MTYKNAKINKMPKETVEGAEGVALAPNFDHASMGAKCCDGSNGCNDLLEFHHLVLFRVAP